jgi:hypothetical protein
MAGFTDSGFTGSGFETDSEEEQQAAGAGVYMVVVRPADKPKATTKHMRTASGKIAFDVIKRASVRVGFNKMARATAETRITLNKERRLKLLTILLIDDLI